MPTPGRIKFEFKGKLPQKLVVDVRDTGDPSFSRRVWDKGPSNPLYITMPQTTGYAVLVAHARYSSAGSGIVAPACTGTEAGQMGLTIPFNQTVTCSFTNPYTGMKGSFGADLPGPAQLGQLGAQPLERLAFFGVNAAVGALVGKLFGPVAGAAVGLGVSWLALDQQERRAQAEAQGLPWEPPVWGAPVALVTLPGSLAAAGLRRGGVGAPRGSTAALSERGAPGPAGSPFVGMPFEGIPPELLPLA